MTEQEQTAELLLTLPAKNDLLYTASTRYVRQSFSVLTLQTIVREWQTYRELENNADLISLLSGNIITKEGASNKWWINSCSPKLDIDTEYDSVIEAHVAILKEQ